MSKSHQQADNMKTTEGSQTSSKREKTDDIQQQQQQQIINPSKKRYLILLLYVILASIKSFQWICLASITTVVATFYQVDNMAVNMLSVILMITFLTLALPVNYIMEQIGLRWSVVIGSVGLSLGLIIKCFSTEPDRFWYMFLGQVVIGIVEPFFYSTYSQVAFVWFPDNQVGMATSAGVVGDTLGVALGFLIPGLLVGNGDITKQSRVHWGLKTLFLWQTAFCIMNTILILFFFDEHPKNAPSFARFKQLEMESSAAAEEAKEREERNQADKISLRDSMTIFIGQVKEFYTDKDFCFLQIAFGCFTGAEYALHTVLNQIITNSNYDTPNYLTGHIGLILLAAGIFGSIVSGYLLDRFHAYKSITNISCLFCLLLMLSFTFSLDLNCPIILYLISVPLGIFLNSYTGSGYEFSVELTYPKSELVASTLLNVSAEIFGIGITFIVSYVTDSYGSFHGCWVWCSFLAFSLVCSCLVKPNYNRQTVINESSDSQQQV